MANSGETKTYCVGRLLVEVPASFELVRHGGWAHIGELERLGSGDKHEAEQIAVERARALKAGEVFDNEVPQTYLASEVIGNMYLISRKDDAAFYGDWDIPSLWFEEVYFSSDGVVFRATAAMNENDQIERHTKLLAVAKATRPREPDEIPRGEGTCLKDAFIALPAESESVGATFSHPTERPLGLEISYTIRPPGGREVELSGLNSSVGRRVNVAGWPGREAKDQKDYLFYYLLMGQQTTQNSYGHSITIEYFDQRNKFGTAPMTRQDADDYWEILTNSIQVRR